MDGDYFSRMIVAAITSLNVAPENGLPGLTISLLLDWLNSQIVNVGDDKAAVTMHTLESQGSLAKLVRWTSVVLCYCFGPRDNIDRSGLVVRLRAELAVEYLWRVKC